MSAAKGTRPPNAGKGRVAGVPNKATKAAREAIAALVDGNAHRLEGWLDRIAKEEGPKEAWRCFMDVVEYHIPKLARTEVTGELKVDAVAKVEWVVVKPGEEMK